MSFTADFPELLLTGSQALLDEFYILDETDAVNKLITQSQLESNMLKQAHQRAHRYISHVRETELNKGGIDGFMLQYDLSSDEGIVLMCLAESLLRIPDKETVDKLIKDKISVANWSQHLGQSSSLFVNAATLGLLLTGKVLHTSESSPDKMTSIFKKLISRSGEPIIRQALKQAMKILGQQFVLGETIEKAIKRSGKYHKQYCYSFDMLGEAAVTMQDAEHYFLAYQQAIQTLATGSQPNPVTANGISIKLSALHPCYESHQVARVYKELYPKLMTLTELAAERNINLTIDAEEARRLDISLDLFSKLVKEPRFKSWDGLGLAIQAYQKRASRVVDYINELAKNHQRRLMCRLVKGAYWDSEIKTAQEQGLDGYPVFTRKTATDVSYLVAARKMLHASDWIYPQFASHNALTISMILEMAAGKPCELQRLHGMGESLFDAIMQESPDSVNYRVYAPVGSHKHLLAYLVRRLLENGANTSFVNRIADRAFPIEQMLQNPVEKIASKANKPNPGIVLPPHIFGTERKNAKGLDLNCLKQRRETLDIMQHDAETVWSVSSVINGESAVGHKQHETVEPGNQYKQVASVGFATSEMVTKAITIAEEFQSDWNNTPLQERASCLEKAAGLLEQKMPFFMTIAVREAGKTWENAIAEVREAIDFCRYYAHEAQTTLLPQTLKGPTGELNRLSFHGRGTIACISPWNFPLAIFMGQVVAALVSGNCVVAKPAEQTSAMAYHAVRLLLEAGIPARALQLVLGAGQEVGETLIADERIAGVMFTGSTTTAKLINLTLAQQSGPIKPFIAETGGQNCMIVDSSALLEQAVKDIVFSAFDSCGQRCSALRVLLVQEDIAEQCINMLSGAMAVLNVGNPSDLSVDVGPVIDQKAFTTIKDHIEAYRQKGQIISETVMPEGLVGTYIAPTAIRIQSLNELKKEVFGPVLHVLTYKASKLADYIKAINDTGYGLTLGVQSRIESQADIIYQQTKVGNTYINRNMVGAVVGVQPFGGQGLSGTGPKAGGPHYLHRLVTERTYTKNITAFGGNASLLSLDDDA